MKRPDDAHLQVRNPLVSCVLYITGNGVGGPTLVTPQRFADKDLAQEGWLVHPRANRLCCFDGRVRE